MGARVLPANTPSKRGPRGVGGWGGGGKGGGEGGGGEVSYTEADTKRRALRSVFREGHGRAVGGLSGSRKEGRRTAVDRSLPKFTSSCSCCSSSSSRHRHHHHPPPPPPPPPPPAASCSSRARRRLEHRRLNLEKYMLSINDTGPLLSPFRGVIGGVARASLSKRTG